MRKAVVTGANGFVGAALCRELAAQGTEVIAVVKNKEADVSNIAGLPYLRIAYCDLASFRNLKEYIVDQNIEAFYHLAWVGSAGGLRGNCDVQIKNIQYTCDAVKACAEMGCRKFIFAGSIMEYEIEATMETDEIPAISTLYSSAKIAADYMARTIAGNLGISYIRAVISNVYGPGEKSSRLINTSLRKLLSGEHCAFSAGEQLYDFIYIVDAARTFIAIGEKGIANKTYYIGSGKPRLLKEFLCEMRDQVNPAIEIGLGEIPFNGISLSYHEFDLQAVKHDTGFVPAVSFIDGIQKTIMWIKEKG